MEAVRDQSQEQLVNSAFIGWQVVSATGGKKMPGFQKYAKELGVLKGDSGMLDKSAIAQARKRSRENVDRALAAFQKGVVRQ